MTTKTLHPYYSFERIMSYQATYMFVNGGRGLGKTYGAKKMALSRAIKTGEQFIYLRRYKTEMVAKNTFFADVGPEFPDWDFRINGNQAEFAPVSTRDEKKRQWAIAGYFISLSTAQTQKSVAFPLVTLIIFDEYIIEKGALHYLPNESDVFNNFYSTVDRWKDKTRVLFLANSVSIMNPYFIEYDIRPTQDSKEFGASHQYVDKTGAKRKFIAWHFADAAEFQASVYQTAFGQFIKATAYADYAVGNTFQDNNDRLIKVKDSEARYAYTIKTPRSSFSVWVNHIEGLYYIQKKLPKSQMVYVTDPSLMDETTILLRATDPLLKYLHKAFRKGKLYSDTPNTRNRFIDISKGY